MKFQYVFVALAFFMSYFTMIQCTDTATELSQLKTAILEQRLQIERLTEQLSACQNERGMTQESSFLQTKSGSHLKSRSDPVLKAMVQGFPQPRSTMVSQDEAENVKYANRCPEGCIVA
mmetsp:Transcript_56250/g.64211  ORF Transcript_56250/g.64211 Transcript_56250/m.64211 type:complete len:119 (-) Transcript_56250:107-463(-)